MVKFLGYIPVITTLLALVYSIRTFILYRKFRNAYLLWYSLGLFDYALATFCESMHNILGYRENIFRLWYISGALMSAFTLSQGFLFFLLKRNYAVFISLFWFIYLLYPIYSVIQSPIMIPAVSERMHGGLLQWQWIRMFTPAINIYATLLLFVGGIYSAGKYLRDPVGEPKFMACIFISVGTFVIGMVGGLYTRIGYIYVLYITELAGLILLFYGINTLTKLVKEQNN